MLSGTDKIENGSSETDTRSVVRIQTTILKAIHDFFEEQNFDQLLPVSLSRVNTLVDKRNSDNEFLIRHNGQNLKLLTSMVLHNQLAIGKGFENIYTISSNIHPNSIFGTHETSEVVEYNQLDFEMANTSLEDILSFTEKLLRRIKIDIKEKVQSELDNLGYELDDWDGNFPIKTRHDIELEFGENWKVDAPEELDTPFWITCMEPKFYDKRDNKISTKYSKHYQNFSLFLPRGIGKVVIGSVREHRYDKLITAMKELKINRYNYSNYLLQASNNNLRHSSGVSLELQTLLCYFTNSPDLDSVQIFKRKSQDEIKF